MQRFFILLELFWGYTSFDHYKIYEVSLWQWQLIVYICDSKFCHLVYISDWFWRCNYYCTIKNISLVHSIKCITQIVLEAGAEHVSQQRDRPKELQLCTARATLTNVRESPRSSKFFLWYANLVTDSLPGGKLLLLPTYICVTTWY